ncbi:MAG: peptidase S9 [Candidatus Kapaibacterium sp.]
MWFTDTNASAFSLDRDGLAPLTTAAAGRGGLLSIAILVAVFLLLPTTSDAQYFGRNKVQYENFDFKVMKTPHFDIHFYPEERVAVDDAARMAERWYDRLSQFFDHRFVARKPMILYANQGDFQQTNVVEEMIGEGTGGFTEPLKDRVVLPMTGSYKDNDHVIGHELVHAFQYDLSQNAQEQQGQNRISLLPLWFIEGMAEYLSLGRDDPNTAMWLRDVALQNKIPSIEDITRDPRYFPYRYGQAIWAYIGGRWGDTVIPKLFRLAVQTDLDYAFERILKMNEETLSKEWIASVRATYDPLVSTRTRPDSAGAPLLHEKDADIMNLGPAVSPDGRYVTLLSSRGVFSIDLYLADATTGKIITKLVSAETNSHFDALRFINSSGSWSPDGKKLAFVTYVEGDDQLAILDINSRDIERQIHIKGVGEISNPSWSPDGKQIVFSGAAGGISDIYIVDVATQAVRRMTNDRNADFQPVWSPDGTTIAFVSDRGTDFSGLVYAPLSLTLMNVASGALTPVPLFSDAKTINPQFSPDGHQIYFISDQDGFSDIYRYALDSKAITRLTHVATGVSGITGLSPAMSVARSTGRIMFSVFSHGSYEILSIDPARTPGDPATAGATGVAGGGILPSPRDGGTVSAYLANNAGGGPTGPFPIGDYHPNIQLDYLGTPTIGVAFNGNGAGLGGAIAAYFSDMLGYHHLNAALQVNGSFQDIGGEVSYLYTKGRWGWGASVAHIPYLATESAVSDTTILLGSTTYLGQTFHQFLERVFVDQLSLIGFYPFSTTRRMEFTTGYTRQSYSLQDKQTVVVGSQVIGEDTKDLEAPDGLNLLQGSTAYVGDNSAFGFTSPVSGERFRFELGGTAGSLRFGTLLLDYRHYFFANPLTFAVRGFHYGRYGGDAESRKIDQLFVGYETLLRGYSASSFDESDCSGPNCPEYTRLFGSRIAVVNAEVRFPLFGTRQFGLINFPYLPTELAAFVDGGTAWTSTESPILKFDRNSTGRVPVFSAGVSARANLFGYLVLEVYYAYPFQRPTRGWQFGFQIAPGW